MPVVIGNSVPETNFVGLSPEDRVKQVKDQKLREITFARIMPKLVPMISPEGEEELVLQDNVRDYIRLKQYRIKHAPKSDMIDVKEDVHAEEDASVAVDDNAKASMAREIEIKAAQETLEGLRNGLRELGVEPDMRWGLNRLKTELAKATVNKPAPKQE